MGSELQLIDQLIEIALKKLGAKRIKAQLSCASINTLLNKD